MRYPVSIKGVLTIRDQVVLLLNDRSEWELPGGRIEVGETAQLCLIREFQEELGVNVTVDTIIDSYLFEVLPDQYVFIVTYGCNLIGDFDPILSEEHKQVGLHPLTDLSTIPLPEGYANSIRRWTE